MGRFTIKSALAGLTTVLAATSIFAVDALVDDNEDKTNSNEFEAYWYYYDDNSGVKEDDRPQVAEPGTPSIINVPYVEKDRQAFDDPNDTHQIKEYEFTTVTEGTNTFAIMPFTYGDAWEASYGEAAPYVGIGTMLAVDGKSIDLTGAESITFKMRSRVQELSVDFKVEQQDISDDSTYAYYQTNKTVGTEWETFTIGLNTDDLAQPGWAPAAAERDLGIDQITKIAWEVAGGKNEGIEPDTLEVDDVVITNYEFVSPSVYANDAALGQTSGIFSNFEQAQYKDASPISTYWYAYNDGEIGGTSAVVGGATENTETKLLSLQFDEGSGSDGTGHAPYLQFTLGKTIKQASATGTDSVDVQGFVGIGVNLYDSATSTYFDATTGKRGTKGSSGTATGVYFEYLADGDFKYMTLELSDFSDVGDATTPDRKELRGSGIVYYRNFQKTGTAWKAVSIPFTELIVHDDWEGYNAIPLDLTKLAKLQFKVQGAENQSGQLFVDNVCFPGCEPFITVATNHSITRPTHSEFLTSFKNGKVNVNWNNGSAISGKVNLINTKGAVVASSSVKKSAALNTSISASRIPAGLYFVQFKGVDARGQAVTQRSAVSIVK